MSRKTSATSQLNQGISLFFSEFIRVSLRHPSQALFFARTVLWQGGAARRRARMARQGLHVPPIAIFSITNKCNLRCKGCYAQAIRGDAEDELSPERMRGIVADFMWINGHDYWEKKEWLRQYRNIEVVAALQPQAVMFWDLGQWHMAWNIGYGVLSDPKNRTKAEGLKREHEWHEKAREFLERLGLADSKDET